MPTKACLYCGAKFLPSSFHPEQTTCTGLACQRKRRAEYHRFKIAGDSAYRDQCRDSQRKWRARHPEYLRNYRRERADADAHLKNLLGDRNTLAVQIIPRKTAVVIAFPRGTVAKNTLARCQTIVLEVVAHLVHHASR